MNLFKSLPTCSGWKVHLNSFTVAGAVPDLSKKRRTGFPINSQHEKSSEKSPKWNSMVLITISKVNKGVQISLNNQWKRSAQPKSRRSEKLCAIRVQNSPRDKPDNSIFEKRSKMICKIVRRTVGNISLNALPFNTKTLTHWFLLKIKKKKDV